MHEKISVTEKIRRNVISDILDGRYLPGTKINTEREMADSLSVSRVSVRAAYGILENEGVIVREHGSGTRVSSQFYGTPGEIKHIAVLTTLRDPFSRDFIEAIQESCSENDILTVLAVTEENTSSQSSMAIKMVLQGIRNMIVWGFERSLDIPLFERIRISGVNLVFFDRVKPGACADFIGLDNRHAIRTLFSEALKNGASNFIYVDSSGLDVDSNTERRQAFICECKKIGLDYELFSVPWRNDNGRIEKICKGFFPACKVGHNTALFCVNDVVAIAIRCYVPDTVKIYSIDGVQNAARLGIKTYSQPIKEMASAAIQSIIRQNKLSRSWKASELRFRGKIL